MKGYFKILSAVCMTILGLSPSPDKSNSFKVLIDIIHQNLKPSGISDFFVSAALRFRTRPVKYSFAVSLWEFHRASPVRFSLCEPAEPI